MALKVISFSVDPSLEQKIAAYEREHQLSRAFAMRKILNDFFEGRDEDSEVLALLKKIDSKIKN